MDWINKDWRIEDEEYEPKRKINNKGSHIKPYIIGKFYSAKMSRGISYNSWTEYIFLCLLELDIYVKRYYVQPIEIDIFYNDINYELRCWKHVPDVLVFRQNYRPQLYQIKYEEKDDSRSQLINNSCRKYADARCWEYHVIYPRQMPDIVISNMSFLMGFAKKRLRYDIWREELVFRLRYLKRAQIQSIAMSFADRADPREVLPYIYYLIATGVLVTNLYQPIGPMSEVTLNSEDECNQLFIDIGGHV